MSGLVCVLLALVAEPEVSVRVEPATLAMGEPFVVTVDVVHDRGDAPRFGPLELEEGWWQERPRRVLTLPLDDAPGRALTQARYFLAGYVPGEHELALPPARITGGVAARTLELEPARLEIRGELAEGEDAPRPLAGFRPPPPARTPASRLVLGLLSAGLALGLGLLGVGVYRWRQEREPTRRTPARSALDELLALDPSEAVRAREAFALASRALREGIDAELGEHLDGLTDEEWIARRGTGTARLARVAELLRSAERVKYAQEVPTRFAVEELREATRAALAQSEGGTPS